MRTFTEYVMSFPPDERLDEALYLVELLSGSSDLLMGALRHKWKLTPQEARVLCALDKAFPGHCSTAKLDIVAQETTGRANENSKGSRVVPIIVTRLRQKTKMTIENVWGTGYRVEKRTDVSGFNFGSYEEMEMNRLLMDREKRGNPWTVEEDADLLIMFENGSTLDAIAYEFGRTERSVLDRVRKLKGTTK